jgi:hypothetical protein
VCWECCSKDFGVVLFYYVVGLVLPHFMWLSLKTWRAVFAFRQLGEIGCLILFWLGFPNCVWTLSSGHREQGASLLQWYVSCYSFGDVVMRALF